MGFASVYSCIFVFLHFHGVYGGILCECESACLFKLASKAFCRTISRPEAGNEIAQALARADSRGTHVKQTPELTGRNR